MVPDGNCGGLVVMVVIKLLWMKHLPLFEGHQGLGELEQQILGVGGALRR